MNSELEALLRVQEQDARIRAIEDQRDSLAPRLAALDKARTRAAEDVARSETALERELGRLHTLEAQMTEHRIRHDKNVEVLNMAHKLKEATAAMAQVESARRVLADEESELLAITRRIAELRAVAVAHRDAANATTVAQDAARAAIAAERGSIDERMASVRAERAQLVAGVDRALMTRYDRVQSRRRGPAVFALSADLSCGSCDTAIPRNRRPAMASGQVIETCEGCGALLYVATSPAAS